MGDRPPLSERFARLVLVVIYGGFLVVVTVGDWLEWRVGQLRRWWAPENLPPGQNDGARILDEVHAHHPSAQWEALDTGPAPPCYWDAPGPWKRARCPKTSCARHGASPWDCPLPLEVVPAQEITVKNIRRLWDALP